MRLVVCLDQQREELEAILGFARQALAIEERVDLRDSRVVFARGAGQRLETKRP